MIGRQTGQNVPPPVAHTHPEVRRSMRWFLVCIIILVMATSTALWRQQLVIDRLGETRSDVCTAITIAFNEIVESALQAADRPIPAFPQTAHDDWTRSNLAFKEIAAKAREQQAQFLRSSFCEGLAR